MINKFVIALLLLVGAGCTSKHQHEETHPVQVTAFPEDILIPKVFMQKIEADLLAESKVLNPVYIFIPLKIQFTEKSAGTLAQPVMQFAFAKGGGQLDLQTIVKGQGSFYLSFPPEQFLELTELEHIFFVSQSPVTKIDNENLGLGCGKWIDLKKNFADIQKPNFIRVNTTLNRHIHVIAGSYIFVFRKINQIFLTQVTLTDSKNKNQLCPSAVGASL